MTSGTGPRRCSARRGFTLIEVLLAIALVVGLAGVMILAVGRGARGVDLEEGARRLATACRMARAEAALRGRRFCLATGGETGRWQILWEPEPLAAPGQFVYFRASSWPERLPVGELVVTYAELAGAAAYRALEMPSEPIVMPEPASEGEYVLFRTDGTSDSFLLELATYDGQDERRAVVRWDGLTGTGTAEVLGPVALESFYAARQEEGAW